MTIQDRIAQKAQALQNRLYDVGIKVSGTGTETVLLNMIEDKYHNTWVEIEETFPLEVVIDFPNNEMPIAMNKSGNNEQATTIHMYDLLPITCHVKHSDVVAKHIKFGSVILYRIKNFDDSYSTIPFQIIDAQAKGNPSHAVTWVAFTIAPVTSYQLSNDDRYKACFDYYAENGSLEGFDVNNIAVEGEEDENTDKIKDSEIPSEDEERAQEGTDSIQDDSNHEERNNDDEKENQETGNNGTGESRQEFEEQNDVLDEEPEIEYDRYGNPIVPEDEDDDEEIEYDRYGNPIN